MKFCVKMYKSPRGSAYFHNGRSNLPGSFDSGGTVVLSWLENKIYYYHNNKINQLIYTELLITSTNKTIMSATFLIQ